MMFHNAIPGSEYYLQWKEDVYSVPDHWIWHTPHSIVTEQGLQPTVEQAIRPMPDDLHERYLNLVLWCIIESAWCQLYRQPQVSSEEFQWVVDYLENLEREEPTFIVPGNLTHIPGMELPFCECWYGHDFSRYPSFLMEAFDSAGWIRNRTDPLDDKRHPQYDEWEGYRQECEKYRRTRIQVTRIKKERPTD